MSLIGTAIPGNNLGSIDDYEVGLGTYVHNEIIRSSIVGKVIVETRETKKPKINVLSNKNVSDSVINLGDIVIALVIRLMNNQIIVDILMVGDKELRQTVKGVVRREDIRLTEIDKIITSECFQSGDLIKAEIISLGDLRQYYLSTASSELGVIVAKNLHTGSYLTSINSKVTYIFNIIINKYYD